MDKNGPPQMNENKEIKDFFLTPCCYGGLLTVSFCLNIKLVFDSLLTFNEEFNIPLDFFERDNNTINLNNSINLINNSNLYQSTNINNNKYEKNDESNNNINKDKRNNIEDKDAPPTTNFINEDIPKDNKENEKNNNHNLNKQ